MQAERLWAGEAVPAVDADDARELLNYGCIGGGCAAGRRFGGGYGLGWSAPHAVALRCGGSSSGLSADRSRLASRLSVQTTGRLMVLRGAPFHRVFIARDIG